MANGSRHDAYLIAEATYGTTPATPTFLKVRHTGTNVAANKDTLESEELRSDRQTVDFRYGQHKNGGTIDVEIAADAALDVLLEQLMGGAWTANVLKAGTTRRSFSFMRYFADLGAAETPYHLYKGCEVASLDLKIATNKIATGSFEILAQSFTKSNSAPASSVLSAATTTPPMDAFTGTVTEGGSAIALVTEVNLKIDNMMDRRFVIGSRDPIRAYQGRSIVTGSIGAYFENKTLLDKFLDETASSLSFQLSAGAKSYTFTLPNIRYTGGTPDVQGEGTIMLTMPFKALLDTGTSTQLQINRVP